MHTKMQEKMQHVCVISPKKCLCPHLWEGFTRGSTFAGRAAGNRAVHNVCQGFDVTNQALKETGCLPDRPPFPALPDSLHFRSASGHNFIPGRCTFSWGEFSIMHKSIQLMTTGGRCAAAKMLQSACTSYSKNRTARLLMYQSCSGGAKTYEPRTRGHSLGLNHPDSLSLSTLLQ